MTTVHLNTVHQIYSTPAQLPDTLQQLSQAWQIGDAIVLLAQTCLLANEPAFAKFQPVYALQTDIDKLGYTDNLEHVKLLSDAAWLNLLRSADKNISWIN